MHTKSRFAIAMLLFAGCTAGPRASMFAPVGGSPVELLKPEIDPFLEIPATPQIDEAPVLPKLGPISSAARQHMWRAANSLTGPTPKSLPSSIPLNGRTPATEASGNAPHGAPTEAKPTAQRHADGMHGFVQLLPPPPEDAEGNATAPRESRFFELPPPPEH